MILTEQEISEIPSFPWEKTVDFVRRIESAVLEKLKAQEPVGSVYRNVVTGDFELLAYDDANHPKGTYSDIYTDPLPPADVVRDAERYRWLLNCGKPSLWKFCADTDSYDDAEAAIDAAMKGGKV